MKRRPSPRPDRRPGHAELGFTLIEVLISLVLSAVIGGVVVAALVTSLNASRSTAEQVSDSADAGLISSYLIRDAQSAGGIDPATASPDATLGVSTDPADADGVRCAPAPMVVKVRFSWIDHTSASAASKVVVNYAQATDPVDSTKLQLVRRVCTYRGASSTQVDSVLGSNIRSAEATCQPVPVTPFCTGRPSTVTLTVTGKATRAPLVSILTASLRSAASQLTIVGPPLLPQGELGAPYPTIVMTTIGASAPTTWSAVGLPAGLTMDASSGIVSGTPTVGGSATVTFTATDASSATATRGYTVAVHAPPVAVADAYSVNEDSTLSVPAPGVLANDPNLQGKTAILYSGVANGALTFSSNGAFVYTPRSNFNGTDSFKYKMNDGSLDSNVVTVTLTINPVNDPPVNRVPVGQETQLNTNKVFANSSAISISDVDGPSPVQVQLISSNGKATLSGVVGLTFTSGGNGQASMTFTGALPAVNSALAGLTFTPTTNFVGTASVRIKSSDQFTGSGGAGTDDDTIAINVTSLGIFTDHTNIGAAPIASGTDSKYASAKYTVAGSGWDIWEANDGFQFLYRPLTGDGSLTARVVSENVAYPGGSDQNPTCWAADNSHQQPCISVAKAGVMFRPNLSDASPVDAMIDMTQGNGSEFIYRKTAGAGTAAASPADSLSVPYWVRLTRRGNDITAETSPNGTSWTQRGDTQTIAMGSTIYVGLASSAVYQLDTSTNQRIKLNTATFDNVAISTPPTAVPDSYSVNEDTTLAVDASTGVLANDSDPEGAVLSAVGMVGTTGLTFNPDGSFTYVPPPNFAGMASFAYMANDAILNSVPATVNITVNPANETPSFTKGADQKVESNLGAQSVTNWATAISQGVGESDQLVDFLVTNSNNSLFSLQPAISADGTLTFASAADATGIATVSVAIHDNGGTAFGAADTSAAQTFTIIVDDAPVVTTTATSLAYIENSTPTLDSAITVADADNANLVSATVSITANYVNGQDTLAFTNQNGITGTWTPATGVLALSGSSSVANYQAALRSITYNDASQDPATATRTVTFVVNDGLLASNIASRAVTVTAVNDAPVVAATGAALAYTENATTALDAGLTVTDPDSANLASATVDMTTNYVNGQDTLGFVNQNGITATWNAATGVLALSGDATVANYQAALRSITYSNNSETPNTLTRTVTFVINDGLLASSPASRTISLTAVNDAPVNSVPVGQATPRNTAEVFSSGNNSLISISDADAGTNAMQVQLVSTNGTTTLSGTTGLTFSAGDGSADATMTFTGTTANINAALAGLSFTPTSNFTGAASLKIVTSDQGYTGTGGTLTDTDTVAITVAYAPVVSATGTLAYTENGTPQVASAMTVTDTDSPNLVSATVTMTAGYVAGQDTLAVVNPNGISWTWTPATGVLALSGTATVANYQAALRSITYNNNSDAPNTSPRTVTFVVNDGVLDSNTSSRTITVAAVNDVPVVTTTSGSMAYNENATTLLDPGITVTDADNANLSSVTVDMTTNFVTAQDTLAFVNQNGITATWTQSTGVLALSGTSSVANYQAALRSITYNNNSHTPTTTTRTVTFVANDGTGNSATASRTITLTAINDAPVNSVPGSQTTAKNTGKVFSTANGNLISISDADAGTNTVKVQLISTNGKTTLSRTTGLTFSGGTANGQASMTFTGTIANINAALAGSTFAPTSNFTGTASLQIITNDQGNSGSGGALADDDTITITVT